MEEIEDGGNKGVKVLEENWSAAEVILFAEQRKLMGKDGCLYVQFPNEQKLSPRMAFTLATQEAARRRRLENKNKEAVSKS
ncbi:MAG: hypothetical protein A2754_04285 [Candidatus Magasanikbacteria bacterium RIFCSPHIGHO2_01_FULL_47_8]|uniref:Uncharacterized protein n=1 Tax=Candidatus Magasanikbacteria bacterium RIFCSPHIGHO2_01_FULL_47_8 TaxID=1798673 RepID=A0A1F6MDB6_9BACT|nr:MAG: hypothetical protein A2754_04285 [Candidatus Magasanikbacteria bacterium RIFCSPHIGHO2_01_FULL_47_8]